MNDPKLQPIAKRSYQQRLTFDDGLVMEASPDLTTLGELAHLVKERKHGKNAYYNVNAT